MGTYFISKIVTIIGHQFLHDKISLFFKNILKSFPLFALSSTIYEIWCYLHVNDGLSVVHIIEYPTRTDIHDDPIRPGSVHDEKYLSFACKSSTFCYESIPESTYYVAQSIKFGVIYTYQWFIGYIKYLTRTDGRTYIHDDPIRHMMENMAVGH